MKRLRALTLRAMLPLFAGLAMGAAPEPQPTVVTSDAVELHSNDTETTTHFTGHVVVTGTDFRLTCDNLETISTRSGDKTDTVGKQDQLKYMLATGHVYIVNAEREAACGRAEVLPNEEKVTLTESPVVTDRANGTVVTGKVLILLKNQEEVTGEEVRIVMPPMKQIFHQPAAPAPDHAAAPIPPAAPSPR